MKRYPEFKQLNLPEIDLEVLKYWQKHQVFEQSISSRPEDKSYVFYEGPPSANGMPGIHHVVGRTIKDIFCRYKTLQGFRVNRKGGWDTHGLPVELKVEAELGITKEDIGKTVTIEQYNDKCRETVMQYKEVWDKLTQKMGFWLDLEKPYITYEPKYMESVWWLLKQIYDKKLLYKGYTIQPYSPKAGTGLSSHEVNQPGTYRDVTDTTVVAQFKTIHNTLPNSLQGLGEIHILAWTTTPWTLPSNTALTVGGKIDYVVVKSFNQYTHLPIVVILAKNTLNNQFNGKYFLSENEEDFANYNNEAKKIPFTILKELKGSELVGIRYEQLLPYTLPHQNPENAFRVISGDFVTTEDGTGVVHTAPTFGADDAKVAKEAVPEVPPMLVADDLGNLVPLVDLQGKFTKHMKELSGKYVKNEYYNDGEAPERSVDVEIAIRLKEENKAFKVEKYVHSYPHCWRTDKPILYYPLDSWFIKVTALRDRMYELNQPEHINWKPKSTGEGRFGNWLKNANDWNLSRSRYWGIPLPIWRTEDKSEEIIIGSIEQLCAEIEKSKKAGFLTNTAFDGFVVGDMSDVNYAKIDLHKHIVDAVILVSPRGKPMKREADLIDVWFDSGSMPYAQWHYPFENKANIDENKTFPADFIAEGVDQTRGWFYTLHAIGSLVFDSPAYKNVISNGLVLDKNGVKMSKRLGNVVDPFETIDAQGADAVRWYIISNAQPWDNLKFDIKGLEETKRKFFGTLYNTYSFFALYANIDQFEYLAEKAIPVANRSELDQWIISKLNSLIVEITANLDDYEPTSAARSIENFVDRNLSNWFVRLSRRRFWKSENSTDKQAAYETLYECLKTVAQLMSPMAPFFSDWLYKNLMGDGNSVHISYLPTAQQNNIALPLEERMDKAQDICSLILSLRKKEGIKVRQPLGKAIVPVLKDEEIEQLKLVEHIIKAEVNIKELEYIRDTSGMFTKKIKANFKVLGKKMGAQMKALSLAIEAFTQDEIRKIESEKSFVIQLDGNPYNLLLEEVEISTSDMPGWLVASENGVTVALDITLTDDLIIEGNARELVNKIQNYRKEKDFNVTDKILVEIEQNEMLENVINHYKSYICTEVLANDILWLKSNDANETIEINERMIGIKINKA